MSMRRNSSENYFRKSTSDNETDSKQAPIVVSTFLKNFYRETPRVMNSCSPMIPPIYREGKSRRIARNYQRPYESLKGAIYQHLSARREFQRGIDSTLIELAARLFADWLYIEEMFSSEDCKKCCLEVCRCSSKSSRYADGNLRRTKNYS
jgi:hypothetical protein